MTLKELINLIEHAAANQPNVQTIVRDDIYKLNNKRDIRYGVFAWLQQPHTTAVRGSLRTFSFTLFYVDRLTDSRSNEIDVQSVAIETLENIVKTLVDSEYNIEATTLNITNFNERFADECAGAFCTISFTVPKGSVCGELFDGSYNDDFNDDFGNKIIIN
jgi:hypothetical protein